MEYKSLVIFLSIIFFGILENVFPFFSYRKLGFKIFTVNIILGLINAVAVNLTIAILLKWVWEQKLWLGLFHNINSPGLLLILSCLVLDLYMYFWHRWLHSCKLGWYIHLVHHTDCWMNISTSYRFHIIEVMISNIPKFGLVYLLGISAQYLLIYESLLGISLVFQHSNFALPLKLDKMLSYVIVTPNYHRAHHSQVMKIANSNYASILTIWDLIFKSRYYPPFPQKIQLGMGEKRRDLNVISLLKLPFSGFNP